MTTTVSLRSPRPNKLCLALLGAAALILVRFDPSASAGLTSTVLPDACAGDCDDDTSVTVNELIVGVNIALGEIAPVGCGSFDVDGSGSVTVDELLLAVQAALDGCPTPTGPRIRITSPRNGDFSTEQSLTVIGRVDNPPAAAMVTVNAAPTELRSDGTFSIVIPLDRDLILNPVLAELTEPENGVVGRHRIVVGAGDSIADGQKVEQAVALRVTDSGFENLQAALPGLLDLNSLVPPGTVIVNNYCLVDTPFGCIDRIDVVVTSATFSALTVDLDSMPALLTADVAIDDLVVSLETRGGFVDCSGEASLERVTISGNYALEPAPLEAETIDVNLIGDPVIELTGEDFIFNGGACDDDPIDDLLRAVTDDFNARTREALEDFLKDPDGAGPLDAPVAAAMQRGLADLEFAASLGESFGIALETSSFAIDEDTDGVTFGYDALATAPPPAPSIFPGSYRVEESFPTLTSMTPITNAVYDVGLCLSNTELNQMIKAVLEAGGLSLDLTELDLGNGPVPITAATLSLIIPEAASLEPNLPITLRIRPTVPPILTGAPGPDGELADLRIAGLLVEVISGLPGPAVTHLRVALDARAAFDLVFDETGRELRVALTPPQREDITVTVLDDRLGVDEARLRVNLAGVVAQFASRISGELGPLALPVLFGLPARGLEISRVGDFPCVFLVLQPQPVP